MLGNVGVALLGLGFGALESILIWLIWKLFRTKDKDNIVGAFLIIIGHLLFYGVGFILLDGRLL